MAYTKTQWVNGQPPALNADNLNKMEDGIYQSTEKSNEIASYFITEGSANKFDKSAQRENGTISWNGALNPVAGYSASDYIPIKPNQDYTYYVRYGSYGSVSAYRCNIYDADKALIETITGSANPTDVNIAIIKTQKSNATYLRFQVVDGYADIIMFVEGDEYPAEYIPYTEPKKQLANDVHISATDYNELYHEVVQTTGASEEKIMSQKAVTEAISSLAGKKAVFVGDSICAGAGATGGYPRIIAELTGLEVTNYGVSGATIRYQQNSPMCISRKIDEMSADADYCILEGGVNDDVRTNYAYDNAKIGTYNNDWQKGFADVGIDADTTFYGAFERMLKKSIIKYSGKKIGYIFVHKMTDTFDSRYTDSKYYMAKKCLEKWGVPYLDLNTELPAFGCFPASDDPYSSQYYDADLYNLRATYTSQADGWHPNEAGYREYYVPKIIEWLKTL